MVDRTKVWFRAVSATSLLFACTRASSRPTDREPPAKASAVAPSALAVPANVASAPTNAGLPAKLGVGAEVEQLIALSKTALAAGVHLAYCNDDDGGPRSTCQDGERSRLILAVNNGYVAAYAREVPTLLDALTKPRPPSRRLAELAALFLEPTPAEEVAIAEGGSCAFALDFTAWALSADETSRQRALDAANDNAVLCGTQAWGNIVSLNRRLVFVAKNEVAAQVLAAALKRRNAEASRQSFTSLSQREAQVRFDEARRSAEARALQNAKLEVNGVRVSMQLSVVPNEAELHAMSPLLDERRATAQRAAVLVRKLAEGTLPSEAELATYLAPATSKAMAMFTSPGD